MKEITPGIMKRINDSSSIENLSENLKIKNDQDIFKVLLEYFDLIVDKYDNIYKETASKIIYFLEQLAKEQLDSILSKCTMLVNEKHKIINIIKNDSNNLNDKEIKTLKELANKLENLEVNISFNLNNMAIMENYNVVKHILFKEKNRNLSLYLIDNYSYLIKAFNKQNENILEMLTENYLNAIEDYAKERNFHDLTYYDEILEKILENSKIEKNKSVMENCIETVINYDKIKNKTGKELNRAIPWYKHLEKKLDNYLYEEDKQHLTNLYGISPYFKKEIIEEGHLRGRSDENLLRYDKNSEYIFTIDNNKGFDKDDAISIKKENDVYKLKIYVADPNSFLKEDGLLMKEARRRVETAYGAGIFPREIISYYMSLNQNSNRYARSYEYTISENGIIIDFKINKGLVNVTKNYSYEEFNEILEEPNNEKEYKAIQNLLDLESIISKKYLYKEKIDEITGESLLESFILFTNTKVAEFFASRGIPFIYKYHSNKDNRFENSLDGLEFTEKYNKIVKRAAKGSSEKLYSTNKKSHDGLNFKFYCHSTSPLHNYADILLNKCEDTFYFKNPSDKEAKEFEKYLNSEIDYINEKSYMYDRFREKYEMAKVRSKR